MKCSFCKTRWCAICRQQFKGQRSSEQHFFFYNVLGCPGLSRPPCSRLATTLILNLIYAVLFPVTLLFAPMIVMIGNNKLIEDQADRIRSITTKYLHLTPAKAIVLVAFSLIGLSAGVLCAVVGSIVGVVYQSGKVLVIVLKVIGGCESKTHQSRERPIPVLDVSDTSINLNRSNISGSSRYSLDLISTHQQSQRRIFCCIRLSSACPQCFNYSFRNVEGSDQLMKCLHCGIAWCWTCRKRIDKTSQAKQHFEWYNVFGCPG